MDSVPPDKFSSLGIRTIETLNLTSSVNTRRVHRVRLNYTGNLFHHTPPVYLPQTTVMLCVRDIF